MLRPYLAGKGGVIRIDYHGAGSAWKQFSAMLKERHAVLNSPGFSVRLDPDYFTTRTLEDVIHVFEVKLAKNGYPVARNNVGPSNVLAGITSGGNTTISVTDSVFGVGGLEASKFRHARVAAIMTALDAFLNAARCMVVVHHHKAKERNFFWRDFWTGGLDELVAKGLSLIHLFDRDCDGLHADAPQPTLALTLPRDLNEEKRRDDAYDDLYDVFIAHGMNGDQAAEAAESLLVYGDNSVAAVHDGLAKRLLKMAQAVQPLI